MKDAQLVRWNPKDEALISRYVQKYMDILHISDGRVQTTENVKIDVYRRIMSHYIELEGVTDLETKMGLLFRSGFRRLKRYKIQDIHMFRRALAAEVRQRQNRPSRVYSVLFPLHVSDINLEEDKTLQVMDTEIRLTTWARVIEETELENTLQEPFIKIRDFENELFSLYSPAVIFLEARDEYEAYEKGLNVFEHYRSMLNLLSKSGQYSIQGGMPQPIAPYLTGPIHVIFDEEGLEKLYFVASRNKFNPGKNSVRFSALERAESISRELTSFEDDKSTKALLADTIRSYGNALETTEWPIAFLTLWQVLELISLSEPGDQNVTKRIKTLLTGDEYCKDLLDVLQQSRHDLVHRGIFAGGAGHLEVQMLKIIVDKAIFSVWDKRDSLPTKSSLKEFYSQASLPNSVIEERIQILEFIRSSREA